MNYLAHAYLSFEHPDILLGNMISDYIKGKRQFNYSVAVQKGIRLHRNIDAFTDMHPVTGDLKSFFRPQYRLYAGVFADIVYDHFLANDKNEFPDTDALVHFAKRTYKSLEAYSAVFPPSFQQIFPYMKQNDWLANYQFRWAIEKSFKGLRHRARYLPETEMAFDLFNEHHELMQQCYEGFFPELKKFTLKQLEELLEN